MQNNCVKGKIKMENIAAEKIENNVTESHVKEIVMTSRITEKFRKNPLFAQKLAGIVMLVIIASALLLGGEFTGIVLLAPMAAASVFSKQKLMNFGIFFKKNEKLSENN